MRFFGGARVLVTYYNTHCWPTFDTLSPLARLQSRLDEADILLLRHCIISTALLWQSRVPHLICDYESFSMEFWSALPYIGCISTQPRQTTWFDLVQDLVGLCLSSAFSIVGKFHALPEEAMSCIPLASPIHIASSPSITTP